MLPGGQLITVPFLLERKIMKKIKLLLIPALMMLMILVLPVSVSASEELPKADWFNNGSKYIIAPDGFGKVRALVYSGDKNVPFSYFKGVTQSVNDRAPYAFGVVYHDRAFTTAYVLKNGIWVKEDLVPISKTSPVNTYSSIYGIKAKNLNDNNIDDGILYINTDINRIEYNSSDKKIDIIGVYNVKKNPVLTLAQYREKETEKALEKMGATLTTDFGTILVAGGMVFGAVLVIPLLQRFRVWVSH